VFSLGLYENLAPVPAVAEIQPFSQMANPAEIWLQSKFWPDFWIQLHLRKSAVT